MTRLERAVLVLLCVFVVKFVCSTAAHFVPGLQAVDMLGSGRNPVDIWLLLLSCAAVLGVFCLYRRAARAVGAKLTKADAVILGICIAASAAFYLHAMVGRQSLYLWDNATYYNLQVRLESNFADGVFTGVGSTIYKTWFNDYAPLVINLLAEPFFMFTPRTANTFALLCALLTPTLVYYSAWIFLTMLRQKMQPKAPRLFTALSVAFVLLLPLLHIALYRGMPDLLGVAFAFMLFALGVGYDFSGPAPARLVSLAAFTGLLMLTRRSYMFTVVAFYLLYGVWVLARAARAKQGSAALRFVKFAAASLVCVGVPLLPMFWRIVRADYSDRYATYQTGGFLAELNNQRVYLGWLVFAIMLVGILYGLYKSWTRSLSVLSAVGAVLTVLTSGRSAKNIIGKLGGGLYGLYNTASGYLGDILSYSRLLALGLSTGVIATVINLLGTMPGNKVAKLILFIIVFLLGHTANIAINLIGTYVHTNRLQYVEFFSKFYEGGGRSFTPLKADTKHFRFKEEIQ